MGESSGEMQEQQRQRAVQTTGRGERRPQCKRQRAGRLRSPGDDEWQSGGRVARGEGYIGQAKLMGLGEEIRNKFGLITFEPLRNIVLAKKFIEVFP